MGCVHPVLSGLVCFIFTVFVRNGADCLCRWRTGSPVTAVSHAVSNARRVLVHGGAGEEAQSEVSGALTLAV